MQLRKGSADIGDVAVIEIFNQWYEVKWYAHFIQNLSYILQLNGIEHLTVPKEAYRDG